MAEGPKNDGNLAEFHRDPRYERRVVVFYDFLGWHSHIDKAGPTRRAISTAGR